MVLPPSYLSSLSSLSGLPVLVTGGSGFLGRHLVELLVSVGSVVSIFDVVLPEARVPQAKYIKGDLTSFQDVFSAVSGQYCVFHVASPSPTSNNPALFQKVNVEGTANLIRACKEGGCQRIVYTSSASVIFDGSDQENFDESFPLPESGLDSYTKSKLAAERLILKASDRTFFTCSIRPHGIFGPRDPHMVPAMATVGKAGKSRYLIGSGTNLVDFTYVENVAFAHALAAVHLKAGAAVCGQEYFITNKQPILFWEFFSIHFERLGYTRPFLAMPVKLMRAMAKCTEAIVPTIQKLKPGFKPTFTVQAINYAGVHHYYSSRKAERDFGYFPAITMEEGIDRTLEAFQHLKNPKPVQKHSADYSGKRSGFLSNIPAALFAFLALALLWFSRVLAPLNFSLSVLFYFAVLYCFLQSYRCTSFGAPVRKFLENPQLAGRTVLVTGGNKGIGFGTAQKFASFGARVILACRNEEFGRSAVEKLKAATGNDSIDCFVVDLNDFSSIERFLAGLKGISVDFLINNAGAMMNKGNSPDSHDSQFQTNYLGHFYLTRRLLALDILSSGARIVNVSSILHFQGNLNFSDLQMKKSPSYNKFGMYCRTKLAQVAFTGALQRFFNRAAHEKREIRRTVVAVNPGAVATEFIDHFIPAWLRVLVVPCLNVFLTKDIHSASEGILHAACSRKLENVGGYYFDNGELIQAAEEARDRNVQERLWKESETLCKFKEWKL